MKKDLPKIILALSAVLAFGSLIVSQTQAQDNSGAIWTTRNTCGNPDQNVNLYNVGETVYINGAGFDPALIPGYRWSTRRRFWRPRTGSSCRDCDHRG
jgi:hypothetical protein